jgi:hypothetical protein
MPIGAFKLNSIAKYLAPSGPARTVARTVTVTGNAQVDTAQSKFGGASALFDGADDLLKTSVADTFSGDFTAECWFRPANTTTAYRTLISLGDWTATGVPYNLGQYGTNLFVAYYGVGNDILTSTAPIAANTWYHVAIVRSGTTVTLYLNGTSVGTKTNRSETIGNSLGYSIGNLSGLSDDFNGWIDEVRISNTARYTTSFTPSTSPFTNDDNTLLLLHMNGTDASTSFIDDIGNNDTNRSRHTVTRSGSGVTTSTAQSKFGGASILTGSGNYLTVTNHQATEFEFVAGEDFTIEFWFRVTSFAQFSGIVGFGTSRGSAANNADIYIESSGGTPSGPEIRFATNFGSPVALNSGTSNVISLNTWYHYAVSRSGTTFRAFLNGNQVATTTATTTVGQQTTMKIGSFADGGSGYTGYVEELRLSNTARYTAAFTPATSAFTNDVYTMLLLHGDGTNGGSTFTDSN